MVAEKNTQFLLLDIPNTYKAAVVHWLLLVRSFCTHDPQRCGLQHMVLCATSLRDTGELFTYGTSGSHD